jgi:hypothetical protein
MTHRALCHPEASEREALIGNMFAADFHRVRWTTKRMGKHAYDSKDKPIPNFRPVFVARTELESSGIDINGPWPFDHRW